MTDPITMPRALVQRMYDQAQQLQLACALTESTLHVLSRAEGVHVHDAAELAARGLAAMTDGPAEELTSALLAALGPARTGGR